MSKRPKLRMLKPRVATLNQTIGARLSHASGSSQAFGNSRTAGQRVRGRALQERRWRIAQRDQFQCRICTLVCLLSEGEVDHDINLAAGGSEDDANLRWVHAEPCHREKTQREAREAR